MKVGMGVSSVEQCIGVDLVYYHSEFSMVWGLGVAGGRIHGGDGGCGRLSQVQVLLTMGFCIWRFF